MTERWLDQFLGDPLGDATRDEVLEALRGHIFGTLVAEEENPDGSTASHISGILVEASRNPGRPPWGYWGTGKEGNGPWGDRKPDSVRTGPR
jgi:hypothetical protein